MKKHSFETFHEPTSYAIGQLTQNQPTCFNGRVSVRKYRVTVEPIDEPVEVIRARVQALWDACENHHHWAPLHAAAAKMGLKLSHETRGQRDRATPQEER